MNINNISRLETYFRMDLIYSEQILKKKVNNKRVFLVYSYKILLK
jgi:hypothetical protein